MKIYKIANADKKTKKEVQSLFKHADKDGEVDLYNKFGNVDARPAEEGEKITTILEGEKETDNVAKKGDMIVKSQGKNKEQYIISLKKLKERYKKLKGTPDADGFEEYVATGTTFGFRYSGDSFKFEAPWGEDMLVNEGDFLCSPSKYDLSDLYRIEKGAFKETYKKA
jgi:hypothetical protein